MPPHATAKASMGPPNGRTEQQLKLTEGAHNSNASHTRVTGVVAFIAFIEIAQTLQQQAKLMDQQREKFAERWQDKYLPPADQALMGLKGAPAARAKQIAMCFHQEFEYI